MNRIVLYSAALIGLYLAVANATGLGKLIASASSGASRYAKTLQGR